MSAHPSDAMQALREAIDQFDAFHARRSTSTGSKRLDAEHWSLLEPHVADDLSGRRILVVGDRSHGEAGQFEARNADYVLTAESWKTLDPDRVGAFDIVHCGGLLHRALAPMSLLQRLHTMTAAGGVLLISSMVLSDPEHSEFLRMVPDRYAGDAQWWFVPGRLAFRWMVQAAGFEVEAELGEVEGPRDGFRVVLAYLEARREH